MPPFSNIRDFFCRFSKMFFEIVDGCFDVFKQMTLGLLNGILHVMIQSLKYGLYWYINEKSYYSMLFSHIINYFISYCSIFVGIVFVFVLCFHYILRSLHIKCHMIWCDTIVCFQRTEFNLFSIFFMLIL